MLKKAGFRGFVLAMFVVSGLSQRAPQTPPPVTRADILRGEYGRYRANNDLLSYHLDIRIDPEKKFISGKNTIRFKMLKDDTRIQLDLVSTLNIDKILLGATTLKSERELNTVFVDFPETQKTGMNLTPIFDEYLRHAAIPTLELSFNEGENKVMYRWVADEKSFAMPVKVGKKGQWQIIQPTSEWKTMTTPLKKDEFEVATDLYYINVTKA